MNNDFWSKLDTLLFRLLGFGVGVGGCVALLMNNPSEKLFHNIYGLFFLLIFASMTLYSGYTLLQGALTLLPPGQSEK